MLRLAANFGFRSQPAEHGIAAGQRADWPGRLVVITSLLPLPEVRGPCKMTLTVAHRVSWRSLEAPGLLGEPNPVHDG